MVSTNPDQLLYVSSHTKKESILYEKAKLKNKKDFIDAFISEDLTPLRPKLLWNVKHCCNNQFVLCHSMNGRIRMKRSA